jgi:hypothetical protein
VCDLQAGGGLEVLPVLEFDLLEIAPLFAAGLQPILLHLLSHVFCGPQVFGRAGLAALEGVRCQVFDMLHGFFGVGSGLRPEHPPAHQDKAQA